MFGLVVRFELHAGCGARFDALMARTVAAIRTAEPDTLVYVCSRVADAPDTRIFFELYTDRGGFEQHERTPATMRFLAERTELIAASHVDWLTPYEWKLAGGAPDQAGPVGEGSEANAYGL